jgi:hypothetical protein
MSGQIDLNQQLIVSLPLGAWNTVLSLIAKGPWDVADPLMQVMRVQLQTAQQNAAKPPISMRSNRAGVDNEVG